MWKSKQYQTETVSRLNVYHAQVLQKKIVCDTENKRCIVFLIYDNYSRYVIKNEHDENMKLRNHD